MCLPALGSCASGGRPSLSVMLCAGVGARMRLYDRVAQERLSRATLASRWKESSSAGVAQRGLPGWRALLGLRGAGSGLAACCAWDAGVRRVLRLDLHVGADGVHGLCDGD